MLVPAIAMWEALSLLALLPLAAAYECTVTSHEDMTNYGEGITEAGHEGLTPFPLGAYDAVIAFDEDHCIQMCCEQLECYVAVFDHKEASCYLKGAQAMNTYAFVEETGFSTHEMFFRGGSPSPFALEPTGCQSKRGVAFNFEDASDLDALAPGLSWWYNWSPAIIAQEVKVAQASSGAEYIPMIWGEKDFESSRLSNLQALSQSSHLLGFNEPNFNAQADLTPAAAAELWADVKSAASDLGAAIVSPAVNFCAGDCNEEDPYQWLDDFFDACDGISGGCGVTVIATHIYTCEVNFLNKILHGYLKYGMPIWVTEFACGDEASKMNEAAQASYLSDALTLLELHPAVSRYAWFTGRDASLMGVSGADLLADTGELTQVGSVFVEKYQDLQRCEDFSSSIASSQPAGTLMASTGGAASADVVPPERSSASADVDARATEITNVVIGNLGGTGTYKEVMSMASGDNMDCASFSAACVQEDVSVSGPLSPFDEGVSVAFRGPLNLHNIVWYEGTKDSLTKTSSWTPTSSDNLVFMTNQGGTSGCSGEWTICGGSSQSYADSSGSLCASEPTQFNGALAGDAGVNIMTATECTSSSCGFYRDTGMEGWKGGADGSKVMVFEVDMPHCGSEGFSECDWDRPSVWALNSKVLRTGQYGCNCRGQGGNGGCGEFDIVEAVIDNDHSDMLFTTVYDFKGTGSPGGDKYFLRPSAPTTYAAVFRGGDDAYLQVVQLADFDFSQTSLSGSFLDSLKMASTENHDIYNVAA